MKTMKYTIILSALALFTISCGESEPASQNNISNPDGGQTSSSDAGMNSDTNVAADIPEPETKLESGEKMTGFSGVEINVENVVLRERGSRIFLVINERQQVWTEIESPELVTFYTWPDDTLRSAVGNMSADISLGENRLWFAGENPAGAAAIFGAKFEPQTPGSKTFGDPVVIFDAGPGENFSGVGILDGVVAAGIRGIEPEKNKIVFAGSNIKTTTIDVPGFHSRSSFRVASHGGVYAYDNSVWRISFTDKKVKRLTSTGKVRDVRTTDRFLYLRTDTGLGKLSVNCSEPCVPEKLTEGFSPQNWDANDQLVAWNEGEVIRTFKDGKLSSVAKSKAPVLSILVKDSDIYWATKDGLYVLKSE